MCKGSCVTFEKDAPRQPKLPGHRPPNPRIQFHRVHDSGVPRTTQPLSGGDLGSSPLHPLLSVKPESGGGLL